MIEIADGSCIFCIVQAKSFFAGSLLYNLYISSNQGWPPGFPFLNRRSSYVLWDPDNIGIDDAAVGLVLGLARFVAAAEEGRGGDEAQGADESQESFHVGPLVSGP